MHEAPFSFLTIFIIPLHRVNEGIRGKRLPQLPLLFIDVRERNWEDQVSSRTFAGCKSWSEGCGSFSFFAARRPPFAPVPRQSLPDRWRRRRSHCAYPIVLNLEGCTPPPILFPFFSSARRFPLFRISRRERRSDYESARGRMVGTCTSDQIYITLTRYKSIWLTRNDTFAPYKCWQNCPSSQNAPSYLCYNQWYCYYAIPTCI